MADTLIFYKDLSLDFIPHPVTGDIRPVTDKTAVRRSLSNILRTKKGERPFFSDYGSNLERYLFEPANALTESQINKEVYDSVTRFEPRAIVNSITSEIQDDGIAVVINYTIRNTNIQDSLEFSVSRV